MRRESEPAWEDMGANTKRKLSPDSKASGRSKSRTQARETGGGCRGRHTCVPWEVTEVARRVAPGYRGLFAIRSPALRPPGSPTVR